MLLEAMLIIVLVLLIIAAQVDYNYPKLLTAKQAVGGYCVCNRSARYV